MRPRRIRTFPGSPATFPRAAAPAPLAVAAESAATPDEGTLALVRELTGEAPARERGAGEQEEVYARALDALLAARSWPGLEGSPRLLVHRMALHALSRERESQRGALENALLAALRARRPRSDPILILRALAIAGSGESVAGLVAVMKGDGDPAVREYALRALEANPSAGAAAAILSLLREATEPGRRVALILALASRREETGEEAVQEIRGLTEAGDAATALAAIAALGTIGTETCAGALSRLRTASREDLRAAAHRASIALGYRLLERGEAAAAAAAFQGTSRGAVEPAVREAALRGLALAGAATEARG